MTDQATGDLAPLTRSMHDARMAALRGLSTSLRTSAPSTREAFMDMMTAAFQKGGLDARNLADDMGYSISSTYRWIEGRSAPHPSQWGVVTDWVVRRLDAILLEDGRS